MQLGLLYLRILSYFGRIPDLKEIKTIIKEQEMR